MGAIVSAGKAINFLGTVVLARQNYAIMVERLGKFHRVLTPGINVKIPLVDQISVCHDLREQCIEVSSQVAITKDNVALHIDAILYIQVVDPYKASYGVENVKAAIVNLAQTTMRSEIGKLTLDKTFEERETLNHHIVSTIGSEVEAWGIKCLRYEIRDIEPPANIKKSMILQAESERQKRANVLKSEGERQASINIAQGEKASKTLSSEGNAEATITKSRASANALISIGAAMASRQGLTAANFIIANKYIDSYSSLAKPHNTLLINTSPAQVAKNIKDAFSILEEEIAAKSPKL